MPRLKSVEGRDEKGIKKTVCAFLKILHPDGPPNDAEFDEYVAYAVEMRRRVKEQMNKRKSDDEFGRINLSFINSAGQDLVVYCPESRAASATQEPSRRNIHTGDTPAETQAPLDANTPPPSKVLQPATVAQTISVAETVLTEQHFTVHYGDTGHTYESIVLPYVKDAKALEIDDPYIRANHQVQNFVRFCEAVIKAPTVRKITLTTS